MTLHPFGYAVAGSREQLELLMTDPKMLVIDIRFVRLSRWRPEWHGSALASKYAGRYLHFQGLGNVNYKDRSKGIVLAAPDRPLWTLRQLLRNGYSLVLLCACQDYESCHRRVVYDLLMQRKEV